MGTTPRLLRWELKSGVTGTAWFDNVDDDFTALLNMALMNDLAIPIPGITALPYVRITNLRFEARYVEATAFGSIGRSYLGSIYQEVEIEFVEAT